MIKSIRAITTILLFLFASGCGTGSGVPQPPTIHLYLHFAEREIALCSRTDGASCPAKPIDQTDRFFMLKPDDWQALNDYISLLILQIQDPALRTQLTEQKRIIENRLIK